jgi:hypothetical protein
METKIEKIRAGEFFVAYMVENRMYLLDSYPSKNKAKESKRRIDFLIKQVQIEVLSNISTKVFSGNLDEKKLD